MAFCKSWKMPVMGTGTAVHAMMCLASRYSGEWQTWRRRSNTSDFVMEPGAVDGVAVLGGLSPWVQEGHAEDLMGAERVRLLLRPGVRGDFLADGACLRRSPD